MTPHERFSQFNAEACEADGNQAKLRKIYERAGEEATHLDDKEMFMLEAHVTRTMARCASYLAQLDVAKVVQESGDVERWEQLTIE